jgi:PAS domain S-box-containing protein
VVATPERRTLKKPLRVLLVEDSENDALLLLRELRRAGYDVDHERVQTAEAMREALQSPWSVILSDFRMPRFSAMDALEMANASGSDAPFIVVSGRMGEDVAVEAMRGGAYDYVMKSNLSRLPQTVERGLDKAEEHRQRRRIEEELGRRDAILEAVRFAADQFLGEAAGWEKSIKTVLQRLGEATEASRVYVFENYTGEDGELWATMRYEWAAAGISAQIDNPVLKGIPYEAAGFGRWIQTLGRGDLVHGHVRNFPESEQPELRGEEILSIAIVPIFVEGRWWGFIGFDECVQEREWSAAEVGAIGAAAGTLGAAIRRRRIEEQLRGSEERYRAVIEQATDGIYLLDAETRRFVETNPSFRRMFGYTAGEIANMDIYDLVAHPREDVDATIERTLQSGRRIVGERKYRRKDRALLDVEVGVSVISLESRDVICTIVRDITERKRGEQALARSEGRLRQIIEAEPECVKVLGANGSLVEMNPAGLAMIEADSLEQVRGRSVYRYIAPGHREAFIALTEKVLRGGSGTLEFELIGLKGTRRWLDTHAVPLRDAGGGASGLLAITRDITERKRAEAALKENERLYRTMMEQATENIFLIDVESRRIVESNAAFREALGRSEDELHGMTLYDVVAGDRAAVDTNIRRVLEQGSPSVGERRYIRKDGTLLDVEVSASVILRDGKKTLVAVAHDITERVRAQHLLEERVATLSGIAGELTLDRPTETVLGDLARSVVNASTAIACGVVLIGEQEDAVNLFGSYGFPEGYTAGLGEAYRAGVNSPSLEAYRSRSPVLVRGLRAYILADPLYAPIHRFVREAPWDIVYSLPLVSRGLALGAIFFCFLPEGEPGEDEKVFLRAVADQAAVAVENAKLFSEARGKAALEERQKLARELHDSVSQALYGIALGVETARELLPDDPERAAEPLDYATTLAEAGMTEMRALIFELRPESLEREGLVAALEKQAAAVQARHGIRVEAAFDGEPEAPLEVKEALYRVAQEALHNTVKHARAANVKVKLEESPEGFTLEVSDDGVGFDAQDDFPGHLGLKSMRERASRLNGTLEVVSGSGQGVHIIARIPL